MENKEIKSWIIAGIIFIVIIGLILFVMAKWVEYGYPERTWWDGAMMKLDYKFEYFNETHIACCLKGNYLMNGEIKNINCTGNCTGIYALPEVQDR